MFNFIEQVPDNPNAPQFVLFEQLYADRPQAQNAKLIKLFGLGRIVLSMAAVDAIIEADIEPVTLLWRNATGDWGATAAEDWHRNDAAAAGDGNRTYSTYWLGPDKKVWIITEGDRSSTLVILPEEYMRL